MMTRRFLDGVSLNLDFVATAQIDAAVGVRSTIEFDVQLEILELGIVDKLGAMSRADQLSVFDCPRALWAWFVHPPPSEIFPVEQLDRFAPFRGACSMQSRRPAACPLPWSSVLPSGCPREGIAHEPSHKDHVVLPLFLFFRGDERKIAVRDFDLGKRSRISPTTHHLRPQLSIFLLDLQP